jgi:hypothetical protein
MIDLSKEAKKELKKVLKQLEKLDEEERNKFLEFMKTKRFKEFCLSKINDAYTEKS